MDYSKLLGLNSNLQHHSNLLSSCWKLVGDSSLVFTISTVISKGGLIFIKDMNVEEFIAISEEMRKRSEDAI